MIDQCSYNVFKKLLQLISGLYKFTQARINRASLDIWRTEDLPQRPMNTTLYAISENKSSNNTCERDRCRYYIRNRKFYIFRAATHRTTYVIVCRTNVDMMSETVSRCCCCELSAFMITHHQSAFCVCCGCVAFSAKSWLHAQTAVRIFCEVTYMRWGMQVQKQSGVW